MFRLVMRCLVIAFLATWSIGVTARIDRVVIETRELVAEGAPFGAAGAYEKISGRVLFAHDPALPANRAIVDLPLAPRDSAGKVRSEANFMVLQAVDPARRSGVGLFEVSNRGGKALSGIFDAAPFNTNPRSRADFGDALLLRRGYTLLWVGWQFDIPERAAALRLQAPRVVGVTGPVRCDWVVDQAAESLALGHRGHTPYAVTEPLRAVLTERDGRDAPRRVVARNTWEFTADGSAITRRGGFTPGRIYELVYQGRDPAVVGLGLAAVRDFMSYAKFDPAAAFAVRHAIAFGVSQSGRFLRHFLYQRFNQDESGRAVFDGMMIHAAGAGRGSFNHRFAQPSRDGHRYSAFVYPTDLFPFASDPSVDPISARNDRLVPATAAPKRMFVNTGYEYWGRAASLIHTSPDGQSDVPLPANERAYHLAGAQHFIVPFPPRPEARDGTAWRENPLNFDFTLRALLLRLVAWVTDGQTPPPSAIPRIDAGSLVPPSNLDLPPIPRLAPAQRAQQALGLDFGPRWSAGIIDREPPEVIGRYPVLVPQVDRLGNEIGGVRGWELRAPLATYLPWQLRATEQASNDELVDFFGTFAPLPLRPSQGDARPAVGSLYADRAAYLRQITAAIASLESEGFLLPEDAPRALERAKELWRWASDNVRAN